MFTLQPGYIKTPKPTPHTPQQQLSWLVNNSGYIIKLQGNIPKLRAWVVDRCLVKPVSPSSVWAHLLPCLYYNTSWQNFRANAFCRMTTINLIGEQAENYQSCGKITPTKSYHCGQSLLYLYNLVQKLGKLFLQVLSRLLQLFLHYHGNDLATTAGGKAGLTLQIQTASSVSYSYMCSAISIYCTWCIAMHWLVDRLLTDTDTDTDTGTLTNRLIT